LQERILVDLKQLVARIVLEHVGERLAQMALRRKPRPPESPPQPCGAGTEWCVGRARIGGRREEADHAEFARKRASGAKRLRPTWVHFDAAMDARAHDDLVTISNEGSCSSALIAGVNGIGDPSAGRRASARITPRPLCRFGSSSSPVTW
jgi:hypothetical protein